MISHKKDSTGQDWSIVYDKAEREDGSLFFPERLSKQFLDTQRKMLGSYIYANQYQNEIIPDGDQDFKKEWLKYYDDVPQRKTTFAFVDPAISLDNDACFTALVIVDIDTEGTWYLKVARRVRLTATQTVKLIFDVKNLYNPNIIGIESVAYQEALLHFLDDQMRQSGVFIPVKEIRRSPDKHKMTRIRSLVPRFEWQRILIKRGLTEFEDEYSKFPRGTYVDILDALASIEEIAYRPEKERKLEYEPSSNSKQYESWYIRSLHEKATREAEEGSN